MSRVPVNASTVLLTGLMTMGATAQSLESRAAESRAPSVVSAYTTISPGWSSDPTRPTVDMGVWMAHRSTSIGIALSSPVEIAMPNPMLAPQRASTAAMLMGLRYDLGKQSRLYVDGAPTSRNVRMGFEFKPAPSQAAAMARGTIFRMQWSSTSQVSLRLKGGGLTVALRSQF
jgi:hypothetical protein